MMKVSGANNPLIEGYMQLLGNLSDENKLRLISGLAESLRAGKSKRKAFKRSFGAFESSESADEIIKNIHDSRTFNII